MLPVVAIVGRPNVGKSTLFNVLTGTRDALVADLPGVTRDRQYGIARAGSTPYVLIDTGGLVSHSEGIEFLTARQVQIAINEADIVLFVVTATEGLTTEDQEVAQVLRKSSKPVLLVVNKSESYDQVSATADFSSLGMGEGLAVSAAHRRGMSELAQATDEMLPPGVEEEPDPEDNTIRVAILGRPNVGKSTLVNRLLGEERLLAYDQPGTTRDSITTPLERDGQKYELIDTAGVRRRARIGEALEKFSVIKALQAIDRAHVVVLMLDSNEGLTDQDTTLLGHILEQGRALVIALNKWDGLDDDHRKQVLQNMDRKLQYVPWAKKVTISALHGSGIRELMRAVNIAWRSATRDLPTPELTRVLQKAYQDHQPPMSQGRAARLRYAHAGGKLPPRIIIHGNRTRTLPDAYRRYLANIFINHFKLQGTPIALIFRDSDNPYKGRKNTLNKRQVAKRQRLKKFAGKKGRGRN
ncbi:MAG TPA: ribosome biogenesis GTPase Der [Xanthomonadales bacterium]|nr:ribosome biogenesis GTPase Der [Xanthomonadales bacterium]